jgi:hypothetical protein
LPVRVLHQRPGRCQQRAGSPWHNGYTGYPDSLTRAPSPDLHRHREIVAAAAALAPGFGGVNLEDISAPRCVEIEDRLRSLLDIPV